MTPRWFKLYCVALALWGVWACGRITERTAPQLAEIRRTR